MSKVKLVGRYDRKFVRQRNPSFVSERQEFPVKTKNKAGKNKKKKTTFFGISKKLKKKKLLD